MNAHPFEKAVFIAPSTCLSLSDRSALRRARNQLRKVLGVRDIAFSDYLFSSDDQIDHVSASAEQRSTDFKTAVRDYDLVISVAGGTGAEDLAFKIDGKDFRVIRERRPLIVGFSDFTFLLNEIYYHSRVPLIYFPSLQLGGGNIKKVLSLISGEEVHYQGSSWLSTPPVRRFSGIPIGGNLSTFVNFLNRKDPPKFNWKRHVLFVEDLQIDVEDLHRHLAALRRHNIFRRVRGLVLGSLLPPGKTAPDRRSRNEMETFVLTYLDDIIRRRRRQGYPLPILSVSNFGHGVRRNPMAIPIGGRVTIFKSRKLAFRMRKRNGT
ncbi:MAG: LD-carboxypeptidase [Candidatus Aminicenantes bacterium]|nr:LD-carboxypeptidase [Candidatus Aminicenantes bacterium]